MKSFLKLKFGNYYEFVNNLCLTAFCQQADQAPLIWNAFWFEEIQPKIPYLFLLTFYF